LFFPSAEFLGRSGVSYTARNLSVAICTSSVFTKPIFDFLFCFFFIADFSLFSHFFFVLNPQLTELVDVTVTLYTSVPEVIASTLDQGIGCRDETVT
jgi:hypothetical protein